MNGDPTLEQRALEALEAAFEQPSENRMDWLETMYAGDAAVIARVKELLADEDDPIPALRTGGARDHLDDDIQLERAGAYKITGLIGRGGMGAVYTAERETGDFEHNVAVKVIRAGVLSDALISRFENERQILANLNHPNIARLFDGGRLSDGSPYIIMEHVDGAPITEWLQSKDASIEARLSLFRTVCAAVEHAHQNLIVHRDITPSNVMVSKAGEVKLIDFGIAKPQTTSAVDDDTVPGSLASLTFTPGFAAPERAQGAPTNTLSDVFSLGKLLEAMLANVHIPSDIHAIISRATMATPEDRYFSVAALSLDVKKFEDYEPVDAVRGGSIYRFSKFFRRRRLAIAFSGLAALGLISAFAVTLVQYVRAETALVSANDRFEEARSLSRLVIFDTYDDFARVSGTLEARRKLADLVAAYVDRLSQGQSVPNDVLYDIGLMNNRLSEVYGGIGLANLGDTDQSLLLLERAEAALERLMEMEPDNTLALAELVMVKRNLSMQDLIYRLDAEGALDTNNEVLALSSAGIDYSDENERTLLRHFWSGRTDRLQILQEMGRSEEAARAVGAWRAELDDEMFDRLGGGEEMAAYLAMQEADSLIEIGRSVEALEPLEYARSYRLAELRAEPDSYYQKTQLLTTYLVLSRAHTSLDDGPSALTASLQSVDLAREILNDDPEDMGGPEGLNSALQSHAKRLYEQGREAEAFAAAHEAVTYARELDQAFPDDSYYQRILMNSLFTLAGVSGDSLRVCEALSEGRDLLSSLRSGVNSGETLLEEPERLYSELSATQKC